MKIIISILFCFAAFYGKNLILTTAINYDKKDMELFVKSSRKHMPEVDIAIITDPLSYEKNESFFKEQAVIPLFFESRQFIPQHVCVYRFLKYLDYLLEHPEYSSIFLSDVRDVVFNGHLFEDFEKSGFPLIFFQEEFPIGWKEDEIQYIWLSWFYGKVEAEKHKKKPLISAATILGKRKELISYLKQLTSDKNLEFCMDLYQKFERKSVDTQYDQAVHNFLWGCTR